MPRLLNGEAHHNLFEEVREEVRRLLKLLAGEVQLLGAPAAAPVYGQADEGEVQGVRLARVGRPQEGEQAMEALRQ